MIILYLIIVRCVFITKFKIRSNFHFAIWLIVSNNENLKCVSWNKTRFSLM